MNNTFSRMVTYILLAVLFYIAFSTHILLGLAAIALLIGYLIYGKRDAVLLRKGLTESQQGNLETGLQYVKKAYELSPNNPAIAINYGYLILKSGNIDKAGEILEQARSQHAGGKLSNNIDMSLALVRWKQDRLQEAIEMLEQVYAQIKTTTLYGSLGYLYIASGDLDRALEFNLEALDYNDSDPVILDNLFITRILREDWDEAESIGARLMDMNPKFPEAYYHDALLRLHRGDKEGALEQLDEALSRNFTSVSTETRETVERKREQLRNM